jgi:tetratricopeptide (TPR) repeat protein/two-component sensor histidine kinase
MVNLKLTTALFILLPFLVFTATFPVFSQSNSKVDSLTAILNKYPKEDTVRARLLIELSEVYEKVNPKEGVASSNKALAILENFSVPELKADALSIKALHLKDQVKRDEALDLALQALKIYEQLNLPKKIADVYNVLGKIYDDETDFENGKKYYERALALGEQTGDMFVKMKALNGLGLISLSSNNYKDAILKFEQQLEIGRQYNNTQKEIARGWGNLGYSYYLLGSYTKAIDYLQKALALNQNLGYDNYSSYNLRNLGFVYMRFSDLDRALDYFNKALILAIKTDNPTLQVTLYTQIGACYRRMKKYDEAMEYILKGMEIDKKIGKDPKWLELANIYEITRKRIDAHRCYQEALAVNRKLGNQELVAASLGHLGRIYVRASDSVLLKLGLHPTERFTKALAYANEAVAISEKIASPRRLINALAVLTEVHEKNQDFVKAFATYKRYMVLNDSLKGADVIEGITRKEIQYEFDKKETELKYQQQLTAGELDKQRLLTAQREQDLLINRQTLTLKEQALSLSNKEKDLVRLAYLKEQAEKQEKAQELSLSQEREKGKERDLSIKNLELSNQQKQNLYLGLLVASLFVGLGTLSYFYNTLRKQKNIIAQQNELNEQTIAILSHDIKEPLLGVKLMLKKLNKDDPFVAQASHSLEGQINAVNGILTNLLKMKKVALLKKDKNTKANVNTVVKNVIQELNVTIQTKSLTIENELSDDLVLPIVPEKLQIIVHNLLSNAVKYSFLNQKIRIFKEGRGFCIQDFGVGLSPQQRSKLMREVTASERGTNQERGNGLGLFLIGTMLQGEQLKVVFDTPEVGGTIVKVLG